MRVAPDVATALAEGRAVVALESTVFSHLGLPSPANAEAVERSAAAIRAHGAVPAITAVLDGEVCVGLNDAEVERVLDEEHPRKAAARDLPVAAAQRWSVGATTVSATLSIAARAGIAVFSTGGIGGVHRGSSGDVSADLDALARYPIVTVCAGAKVFLDLPRTLEALETRGVIVLGYGTDEFPGFTTRSTGLPAPQRVDSAAEVAAVLRAHQGLGGTAGVLVAVPVPAGNDVSAALVETASAAALEAAALAGLRGADVTPYVLARIAAATEGRSVPANIDLVENNAAVAAQVATALLRV